MNSPYAQDQYDQSRQQNRQLASRMRSGTGVNQIIGGHQSSTHYMDALERFQKDYSVFDKQRREEERNRKIQELERKRIQFLERQNKRWEVVEQTQAHKQQRIQQNFNEVQQGKKRSINSNGLAYNPINLTYDKNPQGEKLRLRDQDHKVRGYVRAHNMDHSGNSGYNPLNGQERVGVSNIVPQDLSQRYQERLHQFQEGRRIRIPQTSNQPRRNIFQYY